MLASVAVESACPWLATACARCTHARGAKLVACAAEGGCESTRELRSTWARARARA